MVVVLITKPLCLTSKLVAMFVNGFAKICRYTGAGLMQILPLTKLVLKSLPHNSGIQIQV